MNFYLYPKSKLDFNIMLDILTTEDVIYKVKTDKIDMCFGYTETKYFILNCEYEKFEFIKYLVNKKVEQINKLEKCSTTCSQDDLPLTSICVPPTIRPYGFIDYQTAMAELSKKFEKELNETIEKERKSSKLYSLWKKFFKK